MNNQSITTSGTYSSIILVPKIDIDQGIPVQLPAVYYKVCDHPFPMDDSLTPYPTEKPKPEPLDLIDF